METTLENPVLKEDSDDAKFLEAAALHDRGDDIPPDLLSAEPESETRTPDTPEKTEVPDGQIKPDNSEVAPEKKERKRDAQGRFLKEDGTVDPDQSDKPAEKPIEGKSETQYEKAKKERDRQEGLLTDFQKKKEQFYAEAEATRQELAQREAQLAQRAQQPPQQMIGQRRHSSEDMAEAAREFNQRAVTAYKDGDTETGNENTKLAEKAWQQAQQLSGIEQQEQQHYAIAQFQNEWTSHLQESLRTEPDIHKDGSPVRKEIESILAHQKYGPIIQAIPDGFKLAVEVAKLRVDARAASELREQNKIQKAEIDRLNNLTTPSGGGPTKPPEPRSFDSMNEEEQEKYILRQAAAVDSGR